MKNRLAIIILLITQVVYAQKQQGQSFNQLANTPKTAPKVQPAAVVKKQRVSLSQLQPTVNKSNPADTIPFDKLPRRKVQPLKPENFDELAH